jgi:tRNA modification GTPase
VNNTIAAISTPPGEGAIGIVRMSGPQSVQIAEGIFRGTAVPSLMKSHSLHQGEVRDPRTNEMLDGVLLAVMRGPSSYTGEDMVEIYCHGGPVVLSEVLDLLYRSGAVPAEPGEFSKRAFLNGRMDLCQAEAVLDLVKARTREAALSAAIQLSGKCKDVLEGIRESLVHVLALVEASIDFPEDETAFDRNEVLQELMSARGIVKELLEQGTKGKLMREGVTISIVGKPNVGKSSLLNALLHEERAIVTPVPGTTRDYLSEWIGVSGVPVQLIDTAGLRDTGCQIEIEGVMKTKKAIEMSDLVLLLLDWSERMTEEDSEVFRVVGEKPRIILLNKCDLEKKIDTTAIDGWLAVSARFGNGIDQLREKIRETCLGGGMTRGASVFGRARHLAALGNVGSSLEAALAGLKEAKTPEIIALELRDALAALGDLAGETTSEEVLDKIFSEFCIGK